MALASPCSGLKRGIQRSLGLIIKDPESKKKSGMGYEMTHKKFLK